eukprot:6429737-Prymnesium_polylepis.1
MASVCQESALRRFRYDFQLLPCASAAQRRRAFIDNDKSLACLMIVSPCGQGDGYITAWYQ